MNEEAQQPTEDIQSIDIARLQAERDQLAALLRRWMQSYRLGPPIEETEAALRAMTTSTDH